MQSLRIHEANTAEVHEDAIPLRDRFREQLSQQSRVREVNDAGNLDDAAPAHRPPGTIAHHVKLLTSAGLLAVVGTRQVRSVTEHYYGRTAPTFVMPNAEAREAQMVEDLGQARRHARPGEASFLGVRFLRLPDDRAAALGEEFISRLEALAADSGGGDTVYGVMLGIVPTVHTGLPPGESQP